MSLLMSSTLGGIEVSIVKESSRYVVSVSDSEGLLHRVEFSFDDADRETACVEALDWYDNVEECIAEYLLKPSALSIQALISQLH